MSPSVASRACALASVLALVSTPVAADAPLPLQGAPPVVAGGYPAGGEGPEGRVTLARWTLALDPANRGLARHWQRGGFAGSTVRVPHTVDASQFKGPDGMRNYDGSVAWYRTAFTAPDPGTYAVDFGSANFRASVWIDGRGAGSHTGSYLPFEARALLAAGAHTVVVRVDWRDPAAQSRAGFHRTWFNWGGLARPVTVRHVGESELSEPSVQATLSPFAPDASSASVRVRVRLRNEGPARTIAPEGTLSRGGSSIALPFSAQTVGQGQTVTAAATVTVQAPALWSPASPALYDLRLSVGRESALTARVGLRELRWHGGRLYLNGRRVVLRGASVQEDALGHGDALTASDQDALVAELRAIGANAARAQHPLDPGLLERLDAAGILLWQGIGPVEGAGNWYSTSPSLLRSAERQARAAVTAASLHPSIIAWNLVDEVSGNGHDGAEVRYVQDLTSWIHATDSTRMVAVDVWGQHPPSRTGALYRGVDAIAETDYIGWYDSPLATPAKQIAMIRARLAAMYRTFAGRVLLISEFGAEANALNPPGAPGSYSFHSALLARHIRVYAAEPRLTGMLIWDLRDYPLNPAFQGGSIHSRLPRVRLIEGLIQKGLFTYAGAAKPAVRTVAESFRRLAGG